MPKSVPDRIDSSRQIELLARKAEELKALLIMTIAPQSFSNRRKANKKRWNLLKINAVRWALGCKFYAENGSLLHIPLKISVFGVHAVLQSTLITCQKSASIQVTSKL